MDSKNEIGKKIRSLRLDKGWTQKKLAIESVVSENAIKQYENGKRQPKTEYLEKIADALGVSVDELLGRNNNSFLPKNVTLSEDEEKALNEEYSELYSKKKFIKQNIQFSDIQQQYISILERMGEISTEIEHNKYLKILCQLEEKQQIIDDIKNKLSSDSGTKEGE